LPTNEASWQRWPGVTRMGIDPGTNYAWHTKPHCSYPQHILSNEREAQRAPWLTC